jgi:hypothetical protein
MPDEIPAAFDCLATAAMLRSGNSVALAGHVAAVISALSGTVGWIKWSTILVWCCVAYLSIRVKMDERFFELLAVHPADQLDQWLHAAGLRKNARSKTIQERRCGALRLWRVLVAAVAIEIALLFLGMMRWLA